ncbi:MAG: M3 family metallopeptidase, partial [Chloroflexota bacterium]
PWDYIPEHTIIAEPPDKPQLKPYQGAEELTRHSLDILTQVDPELGRYFGIMAEEKLLDLDTRPGKALGGYCSTLALRKRPFIFMNGVGTHDDVQTLLHEAGHAFHVFETAGLPLVWQTDPPLEFCEVASMSMELLAAPYLSKDQGGFYTPVEIAQARIEHLEGIILFLPYMAVVDAFQHWVYTHPDEAAEPANCDATYQALCQRFLPGLDWSGHTETRFLGETQFLEEVIKTGWQRKGHIFDSPFYYIEYGLAQVGALQVWRNALKDQAAAVAAYRRALAAGCTGTLPELFALAGAEFRFDATLLGELVELVEATLDKLRLV